MSTTTTHRRRNLTEQAAFVPEPPARKSRLRRWVLIGLAALVLLWFLPAIVARTPIVGWAIDSAAADLNGQATVEAVSLGWLSPIRVRGLSVTDEQQQQVMEVPRAESSRTLAGLLFSRSRLGTFRLIEPKLAVSFQNGTSNIEQVLAAYFEPSDESAPVVDLALEIVDGSVTVTDVDRGRSWNVEKLQVALRVPGNNEPMELKASGVVADPRQPGRFDVTLTMPLADPPATDSLRKSLSESAEAGEAPTEAPSTAAIVFGLDSEAMPLALFEPLLGRISPGTRIGGLLTGGVDVTLGGKAGSKRHATGKLLARDFHLAMPAMGSDQIRLANVKLDCDASSQGTELVITRSSVECDLGNAAIVGSIDLGEESLAAMPGSLARQPLQLEGVVDLAQLAAMLPGTLQLRPETKVTSGQVRFTLENRRGESGMAWQGQLVSSELKALDGGREVAWEKPVSIDFAAHETADGPPAGELRCQSDFLKLHAVGTTRQFSADASFNLNRLAEQLGQFVDLGRLGLGGEGWSRFTWRQTPEGAFETEIELHVSKLNVAIPNRQPWREPELVLFGKGSGRTDFGTDTQVETASVQVVAGAERLEARLVRPVLELRDGGSWPVAIQMQGELANLPPRMALVGDLRDYPMAGRYDLAGQVTVSRQAIHAAETALRVDALDLTLPGMRIVEPQAQLELTGVWDHQAAQLTLAQTTLRTTSLAAATQDLAMTLAEGGFQLTGSVAYQGQLRSMQRWMPDAAEASWQLDGRLTGTSRFECSGGKTHGVIEAEIQDLQVTGAEGRPFRDPRLQLAGRGSYDSATNAIVLDGLKLTSQTVAVDGHGGVNMSGDAAVMQFAGRMEYDMRQLSALLEPYVGAGVELVGRHSSPLAFAGPLDLQHARGNAALAWQQGGVYGFPVGPGELKVQLREGVLAADPLAVALGQGQLRLEPKLHLAPGPMVLTLEPGSQASQVQITPAMCASGLMYIAPVLAGVTTAQGAFSIELDRCRVPIDNPSDGDVAGRMIVHSVEVGPGPLIREMAILLAREAPARLRRESVVPFRLAGGRVHHKDLELIFPDVTIRTEGSVGLDQSLAIVASLPVPPKWLTNDTLRAAFQGQEIRIPVGGTLSSPKLNRAELDAWNRRILENAAQNVIRNQVDRGLDRLFGPR